MVALVVIGICVGIVVVTFGVVYLAMAVGEWSQEVHDEHDQSW